MSIIQEKYFIFKTIITLLQNLAFCMYSIQTNPKIAFKHVLFFVFRYDFIEIRDGNSESADLLGRHCSNIAPPAIISSGPVIHIKFVSDYAHQGAGFSLRYEIYKTGERAQSHCCHVVKETDIWRNSFFPREQLNHSYPISPFIRLLLS